MSTRPFGSQLLLQVFLMNVLLQVFLMNVLLPVFLMNVLLPVFLMNVLLQVSYHSHIKVHASTRPFGSQLLLPVFLNLMSTASSVTTTFTLKYVHSSTRLFGANYCFQYSYCCHEEVHLLLSSIVSSAKSSLRNQAPCGRMKHEAAQALHHDEDKRLVARLCPHVI